MKSIRLGLFSFLFGLAFLWVALLFRASLGPDETDRRVPLLNNNSAAPVAAGAANRGIGSAALRSESKPSSLAQPRKSKSSFRISVNPEHISANRDWNLFRIRQRLAPFYHDKKLTPDVIQRLESDLCDNIYKLDAYDGLFSGDDPYASSSSLVGILEADLLKVAGDSLPPENAISFVDHLRAKEVSDFLRDAENAMNLAEFPLSAGQTAELLQIVTANYPAGSGHIYLDQVAWGRVVKDAESLLSPNQYQLFLHSVTIQNYLNEYKRRSGINTRRTIRGI